MRSPLRVYGFFVGMFVHNNKALLKKINRAQFPMVLEVFRGMTDFTIWRDRKQP